MFFLVPVGFLYIFKKMSIQVFCLFFNWAVCFVGRFLIIDLISLLVTGLHEFSFPSWFSLGSVYVSRNLSISSWLSKLFCVIIQSSFLNPLFL